MSVVILSGAKPPIVNPNAVLGEIVLNISHSLNSLSDKSFALNSSKMA